MSTFVVLNKAEVPSDSLSAMIASVRCQLAKDFCPAWGLQGSTVRLGTLDEEDHLVDDEVGVSLFKNPDVANAGGYHDKDPLGRAYCKVFTEPYLDNGGSWTSGKDSVSVAFSHEILEATRDPNASNWCLMSDGRFTADEVCDAVEDEFYLSEGVAVSNFLLAAWSDEGNAGPYDFMGVLKKSFAVTPGGYWLITTSTGDVQAEFGEKMAQWKRDLKLQSKRVLMRAWLSEVSVFDPATAKLDPVTDRYKPRMLIQMARERGLQSFDRPPTVGRRVTTVTGQPVVQGVAKPVNNSNQKLGKRKW